MLQTHYDNDPPHLLMLIKQRDQFNRKMLRSGFYAKSATYG